MRLALSAAVAVLFVSACSSNSDSDKNTGAEKNWGEMVWDQDNWS